ncbi:WS/DGAT/MGAT family O-acyltransferase [Kineococcus indalonis]|uniref:hypothetical protein n=1 Tax=Kineococcus indalonis TaxID=2696566 RepID=UPI0014134A9B|nr:hypothetical protein [Kineococcus indalonis]NAZ85056.1 hypothetical protein [Kineococcus indalonis]
MRGAAGVRTTAPSARADRRGAPAPAPSPPSEHPISRRDWTWRHYRYVVVDGPLVGVDAATLRAGLRAQWLAGTAGRALRRIDWARAVWVDVPAEDLEAHLRRVVVEDPGLASSAPERTAERLLNEPDDDLPMRLVVGGGHVAMRFHHLIGDGGNGRALVSWVDHLSVGRTPPDLPVFDGVQQPFRAALSTTFGGRGLPWSGLRETALLIHRARAAARGARSSPPEGWRPETSVEVAAVLGRAAEELRTWRRSHAPGVSSAMLLSAAVWAALREHGLVGADLVPGVAVDLRAYLPRRSAVEGNFTTCVPVPPGTPPSPVALRDAVDAAVRSGVPLLAASAQAAAQEVRAALRGRAPGALDAPAVHHNPSLVLSFVGRLRHYDKLDWVPGSPRTHFEAPSVDGSRALTASCSELQDGYRCTVTFHASALPRERVRAALDDLAGGPAALLDAAAAAAR